MPLKSGDEGDPVFYHLGRTVSLGTPVILSRVGSLMLFVVDTAMVGYYASSELAFYGLANALQVVFLLFGIGSLVGTGVLTAQARGAKCLSECGPVWRVALRHAYLLGALFFLLSLFGEPFFLLIGQSAELSLGASGVLVFLAAGLPGHFAFVASTLFLETLDRPRFGLYAMIVANLLNVIGNLIFIFGAYGELEMGADGAALVTTLVRWGAAIGLIISVWWIADRQKYQIRGRISDPGDIGRRLRRLGFPLGLAQALESMAFASLTFMAGYLGSDAVAGFQINMSIVAFCYMSAIGISTATAVRVSYFIGEKNRKNMIRAGWSGLLIILICMTILAVIMWNFSGNIAGLFTVDMNVLLIASATLVISAITLPADGAQGVLMGALRGIGDVWVPAGIYFLCFGFIMMPAAWFFVFVLEFGVPGLMFGTFLGVMAAAFLLGARFYLMSSRQIERV